MGKGMQGRVKRERDCGEKDKGREKMGKGMRKGQRWKGTVGRWMQEGGRGNGIVGKGAAGRRVRGGEFGERDCSLPTNYQLVLSKCVLSLPLEAGDSKELQVDFLTPSLPQHV